jgi:hypothetical protein
MKHDLVEDLDLKKIIETKKHMEIVELTKEEKIIQLKKNDLVMQDHATLTNQKEHIQENRKTERDKKIKFFTKKI